MNFLAAEVAPNGRTSIAKLSGGSIELTGETAALAGHNLLLGIRAEAIGVETAAGRRAGQGDGRSCSSRSAPTTC